MEKRQKMSLSLWLITVWSPRFRFAFLLRFTCIILPFLCDAMWWWWECMHDVPLSHTQYHYNITYTHYNIYMYSYAFIVYQFYIYFLYPFYITYVYIYTFYYTWLSVTSLQVCVFFFERLNCPRKSTVTVE